MRLKKGSPGKGGHVRADSFSYTPVERGLKNAFGAWIAGDVYWCEAHEHTEKQPGTKPCLDWLTEGSLRCPRCRPHVVPTWIGYVPLYREQDHKPVLVVVHESAMDLLNGLTYPTYVMVGRVDLKSGVFVRKSDIPLSLKTENEQRKRPVDITRDLIAMWRIPELERWLLDQRRGVSAATLKGVNDGDDARGSDLADASASDSSVPLLGDSWMGALSPDAQAEIRRRRNEQFLASQKKPPKNGKH